MASSPAPQIPEGLHEKEIIGNNVYLQLKYPKMLMLDRIKIAMAHNPAELGLTRPWATSDEQSSSFTYLTGEQKVTMRCKYGTEQFEHTHFKYVSPAQNKAVGHWPDMLEIQKYLLQPSWKKNALAVQGDPKRHEKTRGTTFDITFSTEPGNKPSGKSPLPLVFFPISWSLQGRGNSNGSCSSLSFKISNCSPIAGTFYFYGK
jgi:hypothetical protein